MRLCGRMKYDVDFRFLISAFKNTLMILAYYPDFHILFDASG